MHLYTYVLQSRMNTFIFFILFIVIQSIETTYEHFVDNDHECTKICNIYIQGFIYSIAEIFIKNALYIIYAYYIYYW